MAVIGDATIEVHADTDRFGKNVNSKFAGIAKSAAGIFAAAFAATKAFDFVGDSLAEAREAAKVTRLTEAVVKSTGGAANVSADQLGKLAERLSNIAAVDDEVIQSAGNVLLTFTKVRNEVGKGNNVFDRATEAALNMSAALGTDLQGATLQLGKALNDPIKGMTALGRAGVSFTQQQKDQVKALVESGKTLEAQKIILAEMETQFGGAAAAAADPTARLGVVIGNLKERIGTALLPVVEAAATYLGDHLPGALDVAARFFHRARDAIAPLIAAVREVYGILVNSDFTGVGPWAEDSAIVDALFNIRESVAGLVQTFRDQWLPVIMQVAGFVGDNLKPILIGLAVTVGLLLSPLATVAAGVFLAYQRFEGFREVVDTVARFLTGTIAPALAAFGQQVIRSFGDAVAWVQRFWPQISEAVDHVMRVVRTIVETVGGAIAAFWRAWGDDLQRIVATVWNYIRETIDNALRVVQGLIRTVLALINGDWGRAWDGIKQVLGAVWDQIGNIISTAAGLVRSLVAGLLSTVGTLWSGGWNMIKGTLGDVWNGIVDAVVRGKDRVLETIRGLPGTIVDALSGLAGSLVQVGKDAIGGLWDGMYAATIGKVKTGLAWVTDKIPDWKGPLSKDRQLLVPTGNAIMEGLVAGIRNGSADVQTYLRAVTQNVVTTVQSALGNLRALSGVAGAKQALEDAEAERARLLARQNALPAELRAAVQAMAAARDAAREVTPAEQLAINRAKQNVIDKEEALKEMRKEGTASALELRIAEGELVVAQEAVTEAEAAAIGVTDELAQAQQRVTDLRAEGAAIADELAAATDRVRQAELGVVDAHAQMMQSAAEVSGNRQLLEWFQEVAREAGLSEQAVRRLVDTIGNTPNTPGGTTPGAPRTPGDMTRPIPPGGKTPAVTADQIANIGKFVGEQWSADKVNRIVEQIAKGQRTIDSVIADVSARINGPQAVVNFQSIDTPALLQKMNIKGAVGEALTSATRLKPVVR